MTDRAREVDVTLSRQVARVMDDAVTVPGTRIGLGLDAVIGLVPGIGDALGSALSGIIVRDAVRARVPMVVLARMGLNLVVDALLGLLPGLGDLLDVAHRANRKNLHLLLREIEREPMREPLTTGYRSSVPLPWDGTISRCCSDNPPPRRCHMGGQRPTTRAPGRWRARPTSRTTSTPNQRRTRRWSASAKTMPSAPG